MARLPEDVLGLIEEPVSVKVIATVDKEKGVNVIPLSVLKAIDEETLAFACSMQGKTKENMEATRRSVIGVYQPPIEGYQIKGTFLKWHTSGELYDQLVEEAEEMMQSQGLSSPIKLEAVGVIKVTEAYALSLPMAGEKVA